MKLYIAIGVLAFLAVAHSQVTTWGNTNDPRVLLRYIDKSSKFMQKVIEEVNITQSDINWRVITGIKVTDQLPEKKRGYAALNGGGVGMNFANIRFKSERGEKIQSILEIYAR